MEKGSPTKVLDSILMDPFYDVNCTLLNLSYTRGGFHYLAPSTDASSPGATGDPKVASDCLYDERIAEVEPLKTCLNF